MNYHPPHVEIGLILGIGYILMFAVLILGGK